MLVNSTMLMQQIRISPQMGFIFSLMEIRLFNVSEINRNQMNPYHFEHQLSDMDFLILRNSSERFWTIYISYVNKKGKRSEY